MSKFTRRALLALVVPIAVAPAAACRQSTTANSNAAPARPPTPAPAPIVIDAGSPARDAPPPPPATAAIVAPGAPGRLQAAITTSNADPTAGRPHVTFVCATRDWLVLNAHGPVFLVSRGSGAQRPLATHGSPSEMVCDDEAVYYDEAGSLWRTSYAGVSDRLASITHATALEIHRCGEVLYFLGMPGGALSHVRRDGTEFQSMTIGPTTGIACNDSDLYWVDTAHDTLRRMPLAGGEARTIAQLPHAVPSLPNVSADFGRLTLAGRFAYFADAAGTRVMRAPIDGGAVETVGEIPDADGVERLTALGDHVYWLSRQGGGSMLTLGPDDHAPVAAVARLRSPFDLAAAPTGEVVIANTDEGTVLLYDPSGR